MTRPRRASSTPSRRRKAGAGRYEHSASAAWLLRDGLGAARRPRRARAASPTGRQPAGPQLPPGAVVSQVQLQPSSRAGGCFARVASRKERNQTERRSSKGERVSLWPSRHRAALLAARGLCENAGSGQAHTGRGVAAFVAEPRAREQCSLGDHHLARSKELQTGVDTKRCLPRLVSEPAAPTRPTLPRRAPARPPQRISGSRCMKKSSGSLSRAIGPTAWLLPPSGAPAPLLQPEQGHPQP
eukprot:COSAG04_NODE_1245_length_7583_cov_3.055318_3_plen_242_part_00